MFRAGLGIALFAKTPDPAFAIITTSKRSRQKEHPMRYENRGTDIIKHEDGKEFLMVACKVNGMDQFVWEEIKPEVKKLTCIYQPDDERQTFTRYGEYEITRETACFWWVKDNRGYPHRKISKRTMREAGYKVAYAAEFDLGA